MPPQNSSAATRRPVSVRAQYLDQVAHLRASGELEEQLLEACVAGAVLLPQVVHGPFGDDPAVLEDRDAVAHRLRHLQRVRAHQHGAAARHELAEDVLEEPRRLWIEPHHRLVHHDALRAMDQRARDDQLLAHPVAVGFHQLVLPVRQLEHVQQLGDSTLDRVAFLAVQRRHEAQELGPGELVVDERPVWNEAEARLGRDRVHLHVVAAQEHPAVGGAQDTGDHPERRSLARAVRAEASVQHTLRDVERDVVDGDEAAVVFGQVLQSDHSTSRVRPPIRGRSSAWRASAPALKRRCAASAGNWPNVGSTATQSPRYTSGQA